MFTKSKWGIIFILLKNKLHFSSHCLRKNTSSLVENYGVKYLVQDYKLNLKLNMSRRIQIIGSVYILNKILMFQKSITQMKANNRQCHLPLSLSSPFGLFSQYQSVLAPCPESTHSPLLSVPSAFLWTTIGNTKATGIGKGAKKCRASLHDSRK